MLAILFTVLTACLSLVSATASHTHAHAHMAMRSLTNNHATRSWYDQYKYLSAHNDVRAAHGAADLTWSSTLADAAQSYVQSCSWAHSGGVLDDGTAYGENVVAGSGDVSASDAVGSFVSDSGELTFDPAVYNHFSQVVWKNTTQVGCASQSRCSGILDSDATLVACFYSPPGNIIGELAENVQL